MMQYMSTVQAAEKWGISIRRIAVLCKENRIPGAKQMGSRWMIPENTSKPADGRKKLSRLLPTEETYFRFPAFEGRDAGTIFPPLSKEEKQLKEAMEAFFACRYEESVRLLGDLPERTHNRYIRIAALWVSCVCSIFLCQCDDFLDSYGKLTFETQQDFPHKIEMLEFAHKVDAYLGIGNCFPCEFRMEPGYAYHESFLPHLTALCAISLFSSCQKGIAPEMLKAYEANCAVFDQTQYYRDTQIMHLYLGCTYALLGLNKEMTIHLRRALELAEKYELYHIVAMEFYHMEKYFEPALSGFSEELRNHLRECSEDRHTRYVRFMDSMSMSSVFTLLLRNEYHYILYATRGYQDKDVAKILRISERTVSKRYGEIYDILGVKGKKELVELVRTKQYVEYRKQE